MNAQSPGTARTAIWIAGCFVLIAGLFLPSWINRQPIMYPDSVGYFHSGYAALTQIKSAADVHLRGRPRPEVPVLSHQQSDGITTARSVYYGITYVTGYVLAGVWGLAAGQVLLTFACLLLAAQRAVKLELLAWFSALAAIVLVSGLNIFAVAAMPDLFAGLMLLAAAMVLAYGPELPRWEYGFWLAVVLLSCLYHKAHLAILVVVLAGAALLPFTWQRRGQGLMLLAGAALVALLGHYAVDLTVRQVTGKPPIPTPFVLARMVGDGTAEKYLRQACPTRHFATCDYLAKMPMSENDFLWSRDPDKSVMGTADRQTRSAISDESGAIVLGTLSRYPLEQAAATARNVMMQLGDVGVSEYRLMPSDDLAPVAMLRWALDHYQDTMIAKGRMPLMPIGVLMRGIYFAALVGIGSLLYRRTRTPAMESPEIRFVLVLLIGILVNAAVSGAISGVFDRYQGRVAWLASLGFAVLVGKMIADRRQAGEAFKTR